MKKLVSLALAFIMAMSLAGCTSTLGYSVELQKAQEKVYDVTLAELWNEETGFHYDRIEWGWGYDQIQANVSNCLTKVYAYNEEGLIVYTAGYLHINIDGRENSDATVSVSADNKAYAVNFVFSVSDGETVTPTQGEFFNGLMSEAEQLFGSDYEINITEDDSTGVNISETTYTWTYTATDNSVTELQIAKANMSFSEEPDYISIAVIQTEEGEEAKE